MTLHVHLLQGFDSKWIEQFRKRLDSAVRLTAGDSIPTETEFLIAGVPEKEHLDASPQLKGLIIPWAGLPVATGKLLAGYPHLDMFNIHHNARPTAEHAMALMLAAAKEVCTADRALRKNDWAIRYADQRGLLLFGKTAVILGLGAIGKNIAAICSGLQMSVIGLTASGRTHSEYTVQPIEKLNDILPKAGVLFVTVPLTEQTRGLIDRTKLALLPDNSIIVNMSRGDVIDERALYNELASGRIRAGLDVWYQYPKEKQARGDTPPSQYDFGALPNVVMTPHMGGHTDMTEELRQEQLADLINRLARGESPNTRIDRSKGY